MAKIFLKFLFQISVLTSLLVLSHYFLLGNSDFSLKNNFIFNSYLFLVTLNMASFLILIFVKDIKEEFVGYTFLGLVLIKMVISFIYLYPTIISEIPKKENLILVFFAFYFIYLIFETIVIVNLVKLKKE